MNLGAGQRLRYGTVLFGVQRLFLQGRLIDARNVGLSLQVNPSVSRSILVMANASPTFSSFTFAAVWIRVGVRPARASCAVSAMVKHPASAAPISSSGFVAEWPSSKRDLNEYGPSKAPLPTFSRPLPWARLPVHSASALWIGIKSPFDWLLMLYWILRRVRLLRRVSVLTHKFQAAGTNKGGAEEPLLMPCPPLLTAYTCAKPPSTNSSVPVM